LLKLEAGSSYDDLFNKFNKEKASLPSPKRKGRRENTGIQHNQSYLKAQCENVDIETAQEEDNPTPEPPETFTADNDDPTPRQLPRTHVPPLNAPAQYMTIPPALNLAQGKFKQCVFWPLCDNDARICGGICEDMCSVFGKKEAPSMSEVARQRRYRTWSKSGLTRDCAWACCGMAVDCGGLIKNDCSKYGIDGTHVDSRPSEDEMKQMRLIKRAAKKKLARDLKKKKD
jgi:hypothetical protein